MTPRREQTLPADVETESRAKRQEGFCLLHSLCVFAPLREKEREPEAKAMLAEAACRLSSGEGAFWLSPTKDAKEIESVMLSESTQSLARRPRPASQWGALRATQKATYSGTAESQLTSGGLNPAAPPRGIVKMQERT